MLKKKIIKFPNNIKKMKPKSFFSGYFKTLEKLLMKVNKMKIYKILNSTIKKIIILLLETVDLQLFQIIYDFNKGIKLSSKRRLIKVISLSSSIETITAISNDMIMMKFFHSS